MYRAYDITIRQKYLLEAMKIILEHESDFDKITRSVSRDSDGYIVITFSFYPYIYEDFETIENEFKEAGIHIM